MRRHARRKKNPAEAGRPAGWAALLTATILLCTAHPVMTAEPPAQLPSSDKGGSITVDEAYPQTTTSEAGAGELAWELPGRISIYDLHLGPAVYRDKALRFLGKSRTFKVEGISNRLTLMVRFAYKANRGDIPLKFVVRLPDSRPYEEIVRLGARSGQYDYSFTLHRPEDFLGNGSVYLYYGINIVDVLDFSIVPGS